MGKYSLYWPLNFELLNPSFNWHHPVLFFNFYIYYVNILLRQSTNVCFHSHLAMYNIKKGIRLKSLKSIQKYSVHFFVRTTNYCTFARINISPWSLEIGWLLVRLVPLYLWEHSPDKPSVLRSHLTSPGRTWPRRKQVYKPWLCVNTSWSIMLYAAHISPWRACSSWLQMTHIMLSFTHHIPATSL